MLQTRGEVDEVLQAMNEENERLARQAERLTRQAERGYAEQVRRLSWVDGTKVCAWFGFLRSASQ